MALPLIGGVIAAGVIYIMIPGEAWPDLFGGGGGGSLFGTTTPEGSGDIGDGTPSGSDLTTSLLGGSTTALTINEFIENSLSSNIVIILILAIIGIILYKYLKKKKKRSPRVYRKLKGDYLVRR